MAGLVFPIRFPLLCRNMVMAGATVLQLITKNDTMNKVQSSCLLFLKRYICSPVNYSRKHQDLLHESILRIKDLANKSFAIEKIPDVDGIFSPYGICFGCNQKSLLNHLSHFKITAKYDLSITMNCLYVVYFIDVKIDHLNLVSQFHLLNNQFYLSRTDFLTQLYPGQSSRLIKEVLGNETRTKENIGILPYYARDSQSCLLRVHNPLGYPSLIYYQEGVMKRHVPRVLNAIWNYSENLDRRSVVQ